MDQSRVILTIESVSEHAAEALKHPHNARRYVPPTFAKDPEDQIGPPTPERDVKTSTNSKVLLTFDRPPNDGLHFVFGSDPEQCDVYIGPKTERISGRHFIVYYDDRKRLVLQDISKSGSVIYYNPESGNHRRKDFVWTLFKNLDVIYAANTGPAFRLRVERHACFEAQYSQNLDRFLNNGHETIKTRASDDSVYRLRLQSIAVTEPHSYLRTPCKNSIYHFIKKVGSGGFGTVHKVVNVSTGQVYAAKKFNKGTARKEVRLLKRISHPHIVRFVDFIQQDGELLLMEFLTLGSLREAGKGTNINRIETVQCLLQGLDALLYLQENGITHRDVKPENILVERRADDGTCIRTKLADFGLSKDQKTLVTPLGTPPYTAPEIVAKPGGSLYLPFVVDTWSLGVVFLEYYEDIDIWEQFIKQDKRGVPHGSWCQWLQDTMNSLRSRLANEPVLEIAQAMLQKDNELRANAEDCLRYVKEIQSLSEVLQQIRGSSPNVKPTIWENDPENEPNRKRGPKLHIDLAQEPQSTNDSLNLPRSLLKTHKPPSEASYASTSTPAFKTVTGIRQQQQQQQPSQLTSNRSTAKPPSNLRRSTAPQATTSTPHFQSIRSIDRKAARDTNKRSILAPIRSSPNCAVVKCRTTLGLGRWRSSTPPTRTFDRRYRSLQLTLEKALCRRKVLDEEVRSRPFSHVPSHKEEHGRFARPFSR